MKPTSASVHSTPAEAGFTEISVHLRDHDPAQLLRGYLAETAALITRFGAFDVLAHIDYPVRYWPSAPSPTIRPGLAAGFAPAADLADAAGFGAGDDPCGFWYRKTRPA